MKTFDELMRDYVEYRELMLHVENNYALTDVLSENVENAFNTLLVWRGDEREDAAFALMESELMDARVALLEELGESEYDD